MAAQALSVPVHVCWLEAANAARAVNGCKVYIVGRTGAKLERAAEAHGRGIRGALIPLEGDVSRKDDIRSAPSTRVCFAG